MKNKSLLVVSPKGKLVKAISINFFTVSLVIAFLAFGFAAGSCRHTFCGQLPDCQAMKGDKCRFSLKSRPSMEAVGIDVYKMVALAGWDIYPIGSGAKPENVPKGTLAGIVIVQ